MAKPALKSLLGTIAGATVLTLVEIGAAEAAVLNYTFEVKIDQGPYAGVHKGSFKFDDAKLVPCVSSPGYNCATPGNSGLSLLFNFMGNTYTEKSDVDYSGGRLITNSQGEVVKIPPLQFSALYYIPSLEKAGLNPYLLSLVVMPANSQTSFALVGYDFRAGFGTYEQANSPDFNVLGAKVSYFRLPKSSPGEPSPCQLSPDSCNPAGVPEPGELAGSAVAAGLLTLLWRSRRKKAILKS